MKPASIHAAYAKCCRAAITILAVLLLTPALAFFARAEKESEAPVSKRTEKDRNNNGKIDTVEETYGERNNLETSRATRRGHWQGRSECYLARAAGHPVLVRMVFSDGKKMSFVERRCPFGLGFSENEISIFGEDRKGIAILRRNEVGNLVPAPRDEIEGVNDAVAGLNDLIQSEVQKIERRKTGTEKKQ